MIRTKRDLKEYLERDKVQLGIKRRKPRPFTDEIWKYEIELRKYEYWVNQKRIGAGFMRLFHKVLWHRKGIQLGIGIAPNTCDSGLSIAHAGCIQINQHAKIGKNLRIHEGVTIGASGGGSSTCNWR